jgi:UDP-N-acetylglucosamine--N-acetylmuramyl-(pentapeptide) pyrophosphoryl-undecaprenol N-acetylglucosamine transferase
VGGYASGPLLYAATFSGVPSLIQEQNSYAGLTNKWLANRVNKICVAYHKMDRFFPKDKLIFTGNPVRSDILDISEKRNAALKKFDLDGSKKTVLVLGGSLGARTLNESLLIGLNQLVESGVQVIWQTGQFYFEEMKRRSANQTLTDIHIMAFIKEMDLAYAAADVVVSRAGALSISELCLVKKPVVFVPSTNVAEDHQTKNALAVVENKGAIMVKDAEAVQKLIPIVIELLSDSDQQTMLSTNIAKLAMPQAANMIATEIKLLIA